MFWVVFAVIGLATFVTIFLINRHPDEPQPTESFRPVSTEASVEESLLGPDTATDISTPPEAPPGPTQYEGGDPNQSSELTGSIASQYINRDAGQAIIAASIDQYLSEGTCELSLIKNGTSVFNSALSVQADVATSLCGPFKIPLSGLSGTYQIRLTITSNTKTGLITGELTI